MQDAEISKVQFEFCPSPSDILVGYRKCLLDTVSIAK